MDKHLHGIHPELIWEFGPALKGKGHRLVITVEGRRYLRPLAEEILKSVPSISGWEFYGYRPAVSFEEADRNVQGRLGSRITLTDVATEKGKFNRINITFSSTGIKTQKNVDDSLHEAFVVTESLVGEEALNRWVGAIEVVPWAKCPVKMSPIKSLRAEVERRIAEVRMSLPNKPIHQLKDDGKWSLMKLKPEEMGDYPAQQDMFVGKARYVELWENGRGQTDFDSVRYTGVGETFCYVKLDGREANLEVFPDKAAIEDALQKALGDASLGCYIGGGTGLVYSYVDLAVTDVSKAIPVIRETLRKGKVSKRSWILFYDTDLAWEWIGIWDDSPPPPRVQEK
jgi:hypothetical protein